MHSMAEKHFDADMHDTIDISCVKVTRRTATDRLITGDDALHA